MRSSLDEVGNSDIDVSRLWPAQCCVPAFLAASIVALGPQEAVSADAATRRELATALEVILAPEDHNPWKLPTSEDPRQWGVSAAAALKFFPRVCERLMPSAAFSLEIRPFNEIPFELYENVVLEHRGQRAILGVSFDHVVLQSEMGRERPRRRAHHVARLSPIGDEREQEPNALSSAFRFDYSGALWLFDDSGELIGEEALVQWRSLVRAAYDIGGGFWIVRREDDADG